jgi:ADP-heptose:LPS heptosyltransferase
VKARRQILVVELLGGFGDMLLVLPAVHALARSHPDADVCVLTFAPGHVLLRRDPLVAHAFGTDDQAADAPLRAVEDELTRRPYDLAVTTTTYGGIPEACRRLAREAVTDLWRDPPADERVDRRFLRLLAADGLIEQQFVDMPLHVHLGIDELVIGGHVINRLAPFGAPVVLVPRSGMPMKEWPDGRWDSLAAALRGAGRPVLVAGGPDTPRIPDTTRLPPGDLRALAAQLRAVGTRGGVVVGGDTGPMRLAVATGTPAVVLFGPTAASRYGPDPGLAMSLQGLPACEVRRPTSIAEQDCWWSARCPLTGRAPACMADLSVEQVLGTVATTAAASSTRPAPDGPSHAMPGT